MTVHQQAHQDRVDAELGFEWDTLPPVVELVSAVPSGASLVRLRRITNSHRGISKLTGVRKLWAYGVNQEFLQEILALKDLELLYLEKVTAFDLAGLASLPALRSLSVIDAPKVMDLSWVPLLPALRSLAIQNAKNICDLTPLSRLTQLVALAVEGSMWTPMRVASLVPVSALCQLQFVFFTNLRVADQSLTALHRLRNLKVLQCAKFFPRHEFDRLSSALPELRCDWFSEEHQRDG